MRPSRGPHEQIGERRDPGATRRVSLSCRAVVADSAQAYPCSRLRNERRSLGASNWNHEESVR